MGKIRSTNQVVVPSFVVPAEADAVLANWGRWNGPRTGVRRVVNASFKGTKSAPGWVALGSEGAPAPFAGAVDADQAWAAEKVICNPMFWPPARALLTEHYTYRTPTHTVCRRLGIHPAAFGHDLCRAACIFWNTYQQANGVRG